MRTVFFSLLCCCFLLASSALAQQTDTSATEASARQALPSVSLPPELDRVLRNYERAWRNHDAEALAALFTADGFVLRSGHPPVRGRASIEEAYRNAGGRLHLRALAFEQSRSIAYIIGGYTSTPKWPDAGTFVLTLRRSPEGKWLITADIDNQNN